MKPKTASLLLIVSAILNFTFMTSSLYERITIEHLTISNEQALESLNLASAVVDTANIVVAYLKDQVDYYEYLLGVDATHNVYRIKFTAYNSEVSQTDDTPFITANGDNVDTNTLALSRDLIRAENEILLKHGYNALGAISFGDTVRVVFVRDYIVRDTMNKRFSNRGDIWMEKKADAIRLGLLSGLLIHNVSLKQNNEPISISKESIN